VRIDREGDRVNNMREEIERGKRVKRESERDREGE
jgi:hypothetical protein